MDTLEKVMMHDLDYHGTVAQRDYISDKVYKQIVHEELHLSGSTSSGHKINGL